jgi:hypothetical protein
MEASEEVRTVLETVAVLGQLGQGLEACQESSQLRYRSSYAVGVLQALSPPLVLV